MRFLTPLLVSLVMSVTVVTASATTFTGNGASGFNGNVGNGNLAVTANTGTGTFTFTFNPSGTFSSNDLVIYIDSKAGGLANTSTLADNGDGGRMAISGADTTNATRTLLTFPSGFAADYAVEFQNTVFTGLFGLVAGGNNSLTYIDGATPSGGVFSLTIPASEIGLTTAAGTSFNLVGSLISTSAFRSNETIGTSATTNSDGNGNAGFSGGQTITAASTFAIPAPEPGTWACMGFGAVALLAVNRRRSRRA